MTDFGKEVRELWKNAEEADRPNREAALADLDMTAIDHWDAQVRAFRETQGMERYGFPLPCLTINTLPQYIGQVVGDRRANATTIKVLPREDGDVNIAEVRSELIRSIELQSKADRVYANTFEQAVTCGIGNFRIDLDYAYEDAFDRDLFIRSIANPLAVLWDPLAADPTGRDASYCFVVDKLTRDEFKRRYPDAKEATGLDATGLQSGGWVDGETLRVVELHRMIEKTRTIALMMDGSIEDVTDLPEKMWKPRLYRGIDGTAEPRIRTAQCKYETTVMTNGLEELSDPFELKLHRPSIIRATGRETWVGEKRVRYGLVRFARDPARLKSYWRSVIAEKLMLSPRANYMADSNAIKGREKDWPNTLVFNPGNAPVALSQQDLAAIMNEAQMCSQDMKDTTGIHEASLGMPSNETSGRAILARQHEGDIATIIYHDNMNSAMQEAGEVLNALIPIVYDTARTIRTVGEDEAVKLVRVNDPSFQLEQGGNVKAAIPNLALGKYDVTISTGPAYMTKRQEASASMIEATQAAPQLWQIAGDLIAKAQDWPDADIIAERIKRSIPPQLLGPDEQQEQADANGNPNNPQGGQDPNAGAMQAMQQMAMQMEQAGQQQDLRIKNAQADKAESDAMKSHVQMLQAIAELNSGNDNEMERLRIEGMNAMTKRMAVFVPHIAQAMQPPEQPAGAE